MIDLLYVENPKLESYFVTVLAIQMFNLQIKYEQKWILTL